MLALLACLFACLPCLCAQAEHALRVRSRGAGVISYEAPAYRKADSDPQHYTAAGIQALVQEVSETGP